MPTVQDSLHSGLLSSGRTDSNNVDSNTASIGGNSKTDGADAQSLNNIFTRLLVAEIQNQDPFSPGDPTQYVNQMATLNQTQATENMVATQAAAIETANSQLLVSLGGQVGSKVMVSADRVRIDDQPIKGSFQLGDSSTAQVVLTGTDGKRYTLDLGAQDQGDVSFTINPQDLGIPPGQTYKVEIKTASGKSLQAQIAGKLEGVAASANRIMLTVAGVGEVNAKDLTRFLGAQG